MHGVCLQQRKKLQQVRFFGTPSWYAQTTILAMLDLCQCFVCSVLNNGQQQVSDHLVSNPPVVQICCLGGGPAIHFPFAKLQWRDPTMNNFYA
jgi:hypothetical protein